MSNDSDHIDNKQRASDSARLATMTREVEAAEARGVRRFKRGLLISAASAASTIASCATKPPSDSDPSTPPQPSALSTTLDVAGSTGLAAGAAITFVGVGGFGSARTIRNKVRKAEGNTPDDDIGREI